MTNVVRFCGSCRRLHRVEVTARDADGFSTAIRWLEPHDSDADLEAERAAYVDAIQDEAAVGWPKALSAGDLGLAEEMLDAALSVNDPTGGGSARW